ncbi:hypothetical protein PACTADRAFT_48616 [Pachysolen tannophilus NRRL Y-2460]|uniref:RCC1-like domain-containing protein n=1 Tax=Pachysolen tannophilus NRRL Y-2460 TaxID=669874 RepID=A0A1E4TYI1_PACTA|nr:hypothetical protein PACTADRAFT_48616 [Pachysolen tannophilus NRRL Y-2460]
MVALVRKRAAPDSNGSAPKRSTSSRAKRSKSRLSFATQKLSHLPDINKIPSEPNSKPLDIFVWGTGSMCELGLGPAANTKEVKRPRLNTLLPKDKVGIVDFAVGGMHTLALDKNNQIWSWGGNDSGVLGRDTNKEGAEKLKDIDASDSDDDDGDLNVLESTPAPVEGLPKDLTIVRVAATDNLSACLMSNGDVYAWGTFRCNEGLLGFMDDILIQKTPMKIPEFENITQLAAGKDHILGLNTKGVVFAWGNGQQYQLGRRILERTRLKSLVPREFGLKNIKAIGSGEFHAFAITTDERVLSWGLNQYGQCGIEIDIEDGAVVSKPMEIKELAGKGIVSITGGEHHSIALSKDGDVYTFGRYDMKEIGISLEELSKLDGAYKDAHGKIRSLPVPTKLTTLPKAKAIAAGSHHSLAVTNDGYVFSWGFADTYAVGLGNCEDDIEKPKRIDNTATRDHDILIIGAGGQFSVSGGIPLDSKDVDARTDRIEEFEESLEN